MSKERGRERERKKSLEKVSEKVNLYFTYSFTLHKAHAYLNQTVTDITDFWRSDYRKNVTISYVYLLQKQTACEYLLFYPTRDFLSPKTEKKKKQSVNT